MMGMNKTFVKYVDNFSGPLFMSCDYWTLIFGQTDMIEYVSK